MSEILARDRICFGSDPGSFRWWWASRFRCLGSACSQRKQDPEDQSANQVDTSASGRRHKLGPTRRAPQGMPLRLRSWRRGKCRLPLQVLPEPSYRVRDRQYEDHRIQEQDLRATNRCIPLSPGTWFVRLCKARSAGHDHLDARYPIVFQDDSRLRLDRGSSRERPRSRRPNPGSGLTDWSGLPPLRIQARHSTGMPGAPRQGLTSISLQFFCLAVEFTCGRLHSVFVRYGQQRG